MMNKDMKYYKMIRTQIQLCDAYLQSINCERRETVSKQDREVHIGIQSDVALEDSRTSAIYLKITLGFSEEDGPFHLEATFKGICKSEIEVEEEELWQFSYDQAVPLLLPYARECIANTLARMQLPIYNLPTMDILKSLRANEDLDDAPEVQE